MGMVSGEIISVNTSVENGTSKQPVLSVQLDWQGIIGDAHSGNWHRQVSLLPKEAIDAFSSEVGRAIKPGEFAENITTEGLDFEKIALLDRFRIEEVDLEVMQIGKECHGDSCAIFREMGRCIMPRVGVFCRVLQGGDLKPGSVITHEERILRFVIITLSDRASCGEYEDRSGPRVEQRLKNFFQDRPWHIEAEAVLIGDEGERFKQELEAACRGGADIVITTGGTGVGPRDIAPDVVMSMADRIIPGIMESIRIKFGAENPKALLSRSVTAQLGPTLVYCLPGSVRAVEEYMGEILKTMEHLILMQHGVDSH